MRTNVVPFFLWICVVVCRINEFDALDCYVCANVTNISDCRNQATCSSNQQCYTETTDDGQFSFGCREDYNCNSKGDSVLIGRRGTSCSECCEHDGCNYNLCSIPDVIDCYVCTNVTNIADCKNRATCSPNQQCYTETTGDGLFTLGCKDNFECNGHSNGGSVVIGRRGTSCSECCKMDGCNNDLCITINISAGTTVILTTVPDVQTTTADISATDGTWTTWGQWGLCDITCGGGLQRRYRTCSNPVPSHGGLDCIGLAHETQPCNQKNCPVIGLTAWSPWSACNVTCGGGSQVRERTCITPTEADIGLNCTGLMHVTRGCGDQKCPVILQVDGGWGSWSIWGSCSVSCGVGLRHRHRACSNPEPRHGGSYCMGESRDDAVCIERACNDGGWTSWSTWSRCSTTCGIGLRSRARSCSNPPPSLLGRGCIGDTGQSKLCENIPCIAPTPVLPITSKPAISAFTATGFPINGASHGTIAFQDIKFNQPGDYNPHTGIFVCRIPGLYNFYLSIEKNPGPAPATCVIKKNGKNMVYAIAHYSNDYDQSSNSAVFHLIKGDHVYLGNCSPLDTFAGASSFSGTLIRAD